MNSCAVKMWKCVQKSVGDKVKMKWCAKNMREYGITCYYKVSFMNCEHKKVETVSFIIMNCELLSWCRFFFSPLLSNEEAVDKRSSQKREGKKSSHNRIKMKMNVTK